ncbi:MAG: hypothetical protein IJ673_00980 [Treponema sp.]|nr:hypothetical protein [Treponema sp.]
MKLSKKILAALSAAALLATTALFASCSDDEDDDKNGTAYVTLPESVGENPLKGKTWQITSTENEEEMTISWAFTDTTATNTESETDYQHIYTYMYSYDANQNLLYLALQSESTRFLEDGEWISYSWSSAEEYVELAKKEDEKAWESVSEAGKECYLEYFKRDFSTRRVRKYTIGDDGSLTLKRYFDGNLPTKCWFYKDIDEDELPSGFTSGDITLEGITLWNKSEDSYINYDYFLSFNSESKTFSGTMYSSTSAGVDWADATKLGTVTGTYTTEGIGTSGCKVTLTFTSLPDGVPDVIKKNTAYELEQSSGSGTIYTLVK